MNVIVPLMLLVFIAVIVGDAVDDIRRDLRKLRDETGLTYREYIGWRWRPTYWPWRRGN